MAAVHAAFLLRAPHSRFHRAALGIAMMFAVPAALLQPLSGDFSARSVAVRQPAKLAALEGQFHTERGAPLRLGGWPDPAARTTRYALEIPHGLSFLAFHDLDAEVRGLDSFPVDDWPETRVVHVAFQVMVGAGSALALVALWWGAAWWRRYRTGRSTPYPNEDRRLLWAVALSGPLGFLALEAGWTVTEVGRQPWIVYGIIRTGAAVTPVVGLATPFALVAVVYLGLGAVVAILLGRLFLKTGAAHVG